MIISQLKTAFFFAKMSLCALQYTFVTFFQIFYVYLLFYSADSKYTNAAFAASLCSDVASTPAHTGVYAVMP